MHKVDVLTNNNKWVKLDMCEDAYGDLQLPTAPKGERQTSLFKKRGGMCLHVACLASILYYI